MLLITPYNTPIYCNCHVNRYPIVFSHRTLENDTVERIETIVGSLNIMLQLRLFLHHLNEDQTSKFRKWEIINKKIMNSTKANIFNHNCIREHRCPKSVKYFVTKYILRTIYDTSFNKPVTLK